MAPAGAFLVMALFTVSYRQSTQTVVFVSGHRNVFIHYLRSGKVIFSILRCIADYLALLLTVQGIEPNPGPLAHGAFEGNVVFKKRQAGAVPDTKGEEELAEEDPTRATIACLDKVQAETATAIATPAWATVASATPRKTALPSLDITKIKSAITYLERKYEQKPTVSVEKTHGAARPSMSPRDDDVQVVVKDDMGKTSDSEESVASRTDSLQRDIDILFRRGPHYRAQQLCGPSMDDDFCVNSSTESESHSDDTDGEDPDGTNTKDQQRESIASVNHVNNAQSSNQSSSRSTSQSSSRGHNGTSQDQHIRPISPRDDDIQVVVKDDVGKNSDSEESAASRTDSLQRDIDILFRRGPHYKAQQLCGPSMDDDFCVNSSTESESHSDDTGDDDPIDTSIKDHKRDSIASTNHVDHVRSSHQSFSRSTSQSSSHGHNGTSSNPISRHGSYYNMQPRTAPSMNDDFCIKSSSEIESNSDASDDDQGGTNTKSLSHNDVICSKSSTASESRNVVSDDNPDGTHTKSMSDNEDSLSNDQNRSFSKASQESGKEKDESCGSDWDDDTVSLPDNKNDELASRSSSAKSASLIPDDVSSVSDWADVTLSHSLREGEMYGGDYMEAYIPRYRSGKTVSPEAAGDSNTPDKDKNETSRSCSIHQYTSCQNLSSQEHSTFTSDKLTRTSSANNIRPASDEDSNVLADSDWDDHTDTSTSSYSKRVDEVISAESTATLSRCSSSSKSAASASNEVTHVSSNSDCADVTLSHCYREGEMYGADYMEEFIPRSVKKIAPAAAGDSIPLDNDISEHSQPCTNQLDEHSLSSHCLVESTSEKMNRSSSSAKSASSTPKDDIDESSVSDWADVTLSHSYREGKMYGADYMEDYVPKYTSLKKVSPAAAGDSNVVDKDTSEHSQFSANQEKHSLLDKEHDISTSEKLTKSSSSALSARSASNDGPSVSSVSDWADVTLSHSYREGEMYGADYVEDYVPRTTSLNKVSQAAAGDCKVVDEDISELSQLSVNHIDDHSLLSKEQSASVPDELIRSSLSAKSVSLASDDDTDVSSVSDWDDDTDSSNHSKHEKKVHNVDDNAPIVKLGHSYSKSEMYDADYTEDVIPSSSSSSNDGLHAPKDDSDVSSVSDWDDSSNHSKHEEEVHDTDDNVSKASSTSLKNVSPAAVGDSYAAENDDTSETSEPCANHLNKRSQEHDVCWVSDWVDITLSHSYREGEMYGADYMEDVISSSSLSTNDGRPALKDDIGVSSVSECNNEEHDTDSSYHSKHGDEVHPADDNVPIARSTSFWKNVSSAAADVHKDVGTTSDDDTDISTDSDCDSDTDTGSHSELEDEEHSADDCYISSRSSSMTNVSSTDSWDSNDLDEDTSEHSQHDAYTSDTSSWSSDEEDCASTSHTLISNSTSIKNACVAAGEDRCSCCHHKHEVQVHSADDNVTLTRSTTDTGPNESDGTHLSSISDSDVELTHNLTRTTDHIPSTNDESDVSANDDDIESMSGDGVESVSEDEAVNESDYMFLHMSDDDSIPSLPCKHDSIGSLPCDDVEGECSPANYEYYDEGNMTEDDAESLPYDEVDDEQCRQETVKFAMEDEELHFDDDITVVDIIARKKTVTFAMVDEVGYFDDNSYDISIAESIDSLSMEDDIDSLRLDNSDTNTDTVTEHRPKLEEKKEKNVPALMNGTWTLPQAVGMPTMMMVPCQMMAPRPPQQPKDVSSQMMAPSTHKETMDISTKMMAPSTSRQTKDVSTQMIVPSTPQQTKEVSTQMMAPITPQETKDVSTQMMAPITPRQKDVSTQMMAPSTPRQKDVSTQMMAPITPRQKDVSTQMKAPSTPQQKNVSTQMMAPSTPQQKDVSTQMMAPSTPQQKDVSTQIMAPSTPQETKNISTQMMVQCSSQQVSTAYQRTNDGSTQIADERSNTLEDTDDVTSLIETGNGLVGSVDSLECIHLCRIGNEVEKKTVRFGKECVVIYYDKTAAGTSEDVSISQSMDDAELDDVVRLNDVRLDDADSVDRLPCDKAVVGNGHVRKNHTLLMPHTVEGKPLVFSPKIQSRDKPEMVPSVPSRDSRPNLPFNKPPAVHADYCEHSVKSPENRVNTGASLCHSDPTPTILDSEECKSPGLSVQQSNTKVSIKMNIESSTVALAVSTSEQKVVNNGSVVASECVSQPPPTANSKSLNMDLSISSKDAIGKEISRKHIDPSAIEIPRDKSNEKPSSVSKKLLDVTQASTTDEMRTSKEVDIIKSLTEDTVNKPAKRRHNIPRSHGEGIVNKPAKSQHNSPKSRVEDLVKHPAKHQNTKPQLLEAAPCFSSYDMFVEEDQIPALKESDITLFVPTHHVNQVPSSSINLLDSSSSSSKNVQGHRSNDSIFDEQSRQLTKNTERKRNRQSGKEHKRTAEYKYKFGDEFIKKSISEPTICNIDINQGNNQRDIPSNAESHACVKRKGRKRKWQRRKMGTKSEKHLNNSEFISNTVQDSHQVIPPKTEDPTTAAVISRSNRTSSSRNITSTKNGIRDEIHKPLTMSNKRNSIDMTDEARGVSMFYQTPVDSKTLLNGHKKSRIPRLISKKKDNKRHKQRNNELATHNKNTTDATNVYQDIKPEYLTLIVPKNNKN